MIKSLISMSSPERYALSHSSIFHSSFRSSFEMLSPNGTRYAFTINDSGHLSLTGSAV